MSRGFQKIFQEWTLVHNIALPKKIDIVLPPQIFTPSKKISRLTVGEVIQRERMSRYWTLKQLAMALDVDVQEIRSYENGVKIPCAFILNQLKEIFKINFSQFSF
jgi:hypothetical protein